MLGFYGIHRRNQMPRLYKRSDEEDEIIETEDGIQWLRPSRSSSIPRLYKKRSIPRLYKKADEFQVVRMGRSAIPRLYKKAGIPRLYKWDTKEIMPHRY